MMKTLSLIPFSCIILVGILGIVSPELSAATITRGPYLQQATPQSITIRWRTDEATDSRVQYGLAQGSLTSSKVDATSATEHEVMVTELTPDTKYFYSVGTSSAALAGNDADHFFNTHPIVGSVRPTRIWVIGDAGTGNKNQEEVRDAYFSYTGNRQTDLWLQLGDNAYSKGTDSEYQTKNFDVYSALYRKSVCWPKIGNHDKDRELYKKIFTLPTKGEAGGVSSGDESYYSFDYGNIHFICLTSMGQPFRDKGGVQWTWVSNDLAQTTAKWIIAYWHHPPYSKGSHDSDTPNSAETDIRTNFLPLLEQGGVDLVLTGHSHSYERSYFINGHYGFSTTFDPSVHVKMPGDGSTEGKGAYVKNKGSYNGTVYAVAGSSGLTSGGTLNHPVHFISQNVLGSMVLDVDGDRLDAKFLTNTGQVKDHFVIEKRPEVASSPESEASKP